MELVLYLCAWLLLYGAPTVLLHAGSADGPHVVSEGLAALLLLVPFLQDEPLPRDRRKPKYRLVLPVCS